MVACDSTTLSLDTSSDFAAVWQHGSNMASALSWPSAIGRMAPGASGPAATKISGSAMLAAVAYPAIMGYEKK